MNDRADAAASPPEPELDLGVLDDPKPFVPDADLRTGATARGRRLRRRHHVAMSAVSVVATVLILSSGFTAYAKWKTSQVVRINMTDIPQTDGNGQPVTPNQTDLHAPFTVLVVGTDDNLGPGRDPGVRADTMMLVHVDEPGGTVRIVSLPRDLYVPIADGHGTDRLNVAVGFGAPTLIRTVNQTFGVTIDHYLQLDGNGLARLVDSVGGVPVDIKAAIRDDNTGLDVQPGCRVLDGETSLALVRSRHTEYLDRGTWTPDLTSDFGRQQRERIVAEATARRIIARSSNPADLNGVLSIVDDRMTLDDHFGATDLLALGRWGASLPPESIMTLALPVHDRTLPNGAAVLELNPGGAGVITPFFADDASTSQPPGSTSAPSRSPSHGPGTLATVTPTRGPETAPAHGPETTTTVRSATTPDVPDLVDAPTGGTC